jgi:hypothetical protein
MKTLKLLLFAAVAIAATSCATITSGRSHIMSISSDLPDAEVIINHSSRYELPMRTAIIRSRENLDFTVLQNDNVVNDTILRPRLSGAFWLGNLFIYPPIGWLVDLSNQNRFTYGRAIHVDSQGNVQRLNRSFSNKYAETHFRRHQQGSFNILLSLPHLNFFHLKPRNEIPQNFGGFLGMGIGVEYFYRNDKSLQVRGDAIETLPPLFLFILSPWWDNPGTASNISVTDNLHINRFQLGYGLNFARNTWKTRGRYDREFWELEEGEEPVWIEGRRATNNMLGMALSAHYRLRNHFHIGVIYRPSILELSRRRLMYEHTISVDFMWKIHL